MPRARGRRRGPGLLEQGLRPETVLIPHNHNHVRAVLRDGVDALGRRRGRLHVEKAPFGRDVGLDFVFHDARASVHLETNLVLLFDRYGAVHRVLRVPPSIRTLLFTWFIYGAADRKWMGR